MLDLHYKFEIDILTHVKRYYGVSYNTYRGDRLYLNSTLISPNYINMTFTDKFMLIYDRYKDHITLVAGNINHYLVMPYLQTNFLSGNKEPLRKCFAYTNNKEIAAKLKLVT